MSVRLGYAGFSAALRPEGVIARRTIRLETLRAKGIDALRELSLANLADIKKIILHNEERGIRFYRIGSDIFPHLENAQIGPELLEAYNMDFAHEQVREIGKIARELGHRLTFHPKQFAQLGSPREDVVSRTILDLNVHANIFITMGLTPSLGSVMVIHGGGAFGDKAATLERWKRNFLRLPPTTRQYIALENDEFTYSPYDLLPLCEELEIPLVLDFFHYKCMFPDKFDELLTDTALLDRIALTWTRRGIKQKVHISSQREHARLGTHDEYINTKDMRVRDILEICKKYNSDAVTECSGKDLCLLKVLDEFFVKVPTGGGKFYWKLRSVRDGGY